MRIDRPLYLREYEKQLRALGHSRSFSASQAGRMSTSDIRKKLAWWRVLRIYWRAMDRDVGSLLSPNGAGGKPAISDQTTLEGPAGGRCGRSAARRKRRPATARR